MRDFVITADSNCDLLPEYIKENKIGIIPHYYDLEGVTYGDEIITNKYNTKKGHLQNRKMSF